MAFDLDLNFILKNRKLDLQVELEQEDCNLQISQCLRLLVITEILEYHEYEKVVQENRLDCEYLRDMNPSQQSLQVQMRY